MCPVLRGETPPVPSSELVALRDRLQRAWGHEAVPTASGPLLAVRVPTLAPDLLRDLEGAADHLPPLDLDGFRGAVLIGDESHLGVSIEMLQALFTARRSAESGWLRQKRHEVPVGAFRIARLPSDPQRRLRLVVRIDADRVADMGQRHFDTLAGLLPGLKEASPGGCRPAFVYLLAKEDHVRLDGDRFFNELEGRSRRLREQKERADRRRRETSYEIARGHLARLEERSKAASPAGTTARTDARGFLRHHGEQASRSRPATTRPAATRRTDPPGARREARAPAARTRVPPPPPAPPASPSRAGSPHRSHRRDDDGRRPQRTGGAFRAAEAEAGKGAHLHRLLRAAGYETRERLVVDGVPLALAAARPEGYPRRVLVTFHDRLSPEEARRILRVSRSAGAELVLVVAHRVDDGVDRVALATNLKVIAPDEVAGLRLD